jgi:hypothetical protein
MLKLKRRENFNHIINTLIDGNLFLFIFHSGSEEFQENLNLLINAVGMVIMVYWSIGLGSGRWHSY